MLLGTIQAAREGAEPRECGTSIRVGRAEERGATAETTHSSSLSSEFEADECGRPDVLITSIEREWAAEGERQSVHP